jgi:ABC-type sugar transport system ATPase subunit
MQALVEARNLHKVYKADGVETPALRGVDFSVRAGEFTAIAGPSGSGKSTLLHLLGGLDRPSAGEVWLDGERLDDKPPVQRARLRLWKVGFVFQAYNLIPVLTALENAAFGSVDDLVMNKVIRDYTRALLKASPRDPAAAGQLLDDMSEWVVRNLTPAQQGELIEQALAMGEKRVAKDLAATLRKANARWIEPFDDDRLTLVSCWPRDDNTYRIIVVGYLVDGPVMDWAQASVR